MAQNIKIQKISMHEPMEYSVQLATDKDKIKFIKRVETLIRSSMEYRDYIAYLKEYVNMTKCAFYNNIDSEESRRIHIEIHHEPFTLFEIVKVVLNKYIEEAIPINEFYIADEVMNLHYKNMVGLVPLSKTVHQIVHDNGKIFIPLNLVYGDYKKFLEDYGDYIEEDGDLIDKLDRKIAETKNVKQDSFDSLIPKYTYLEVDGIKLPEKVHVEGHSVA